MSKLSTGCTPHAFALPRLAAAIGGLAVLLLLPLSGTAAESDGPRAAETPGQRLQRWAEAIETSESTPAAVAHLQAMRQLSPHLPRSTYRETLDELIDAGDDPLTTFRLRRVYAHLQLTTRRYDEVGWDGMEGGLGGQGCVDDWRVVGPFDNNSMEGFRSRLPPENGESGPYEGKATSVEWRALPDFGRLCRHRLSQTIEPSTSSAAYLATRIEVETQREARLLVGADSAYTIWVDGEPVGQQTTNVGYDADTHAWPVTLEPGSHQILVKLGTKREGRLGFGMRLVDSNLEPLDGADVRASWNGESVESVDDVALAPSEEGLLARTKSCARGSGSRAAWCVWLWSRLESRSAATPWLDEVERLLGPLVDASDPTSVETDLRGADVARLAELFDRHRRRLETLEIARRMAPNDAWIGLQLASTQSRSLEAVTSTRQRETLEELVRRHPSFWPAELRLVDWYRNHGFDRNALKMLRDLDLDRARDRPAYLQRLASLENQAGTTDRARNAWSRLREIAALSSGRAWRRVSELTAQGQSEKALELVERRRRLQPASIRWAEREAELLRATARAEDAVATLDTLLDKRPGNARLHRDRAELLVALDRRSEAVSTMKRATTLDPQNKSLRDFLSHLQPDERKFHEPWMVEDVRKVAESHEGGSYPHDTVVDQTLFHVEPNGLYQKVVQRVERVHDKQGLEAVQSHSISYQKGDEQVDVLSVRIHKSDGTTLQDYDQWRTESSGGGKYYTDQAYVNLQASNVEVGDLVEYRYRVRQIANENFRGDYFGNVSYLQDGQPTGFARYVVEYPATWELFFRPPSLEHRALDNQLPEGGEPTEGYQIDGFELTDAPAVQTDPQQPGYTDVYDYVLVSNKETWDEVGQWWWNLVEEQLIVNEEIRNRVDRLTKDLDSKKAKVEAIHNWVVENTRYLHVGLGIHGWKPYRTTECYSNKYGDCKDKASLLKVMLEEAGVEANLVLVRTRDLGSIDRSPASMHVFNHAINYIPSMDRFLDPTAEYNGTTQLPPMDQSAQALIVEDGGATRLTEMPVDDADDNLLRRRLQVDMTKQDGTVTSGRIVARGQHAVYYRRTLESTDRRDEAFEKQLANLYPGAELVEARYENLDDLEKPVKIQFEFEGGRLRRNNDERRFVFPYGSPKDLLSRYASQSERSQDLILRVPFVNATTMRYRLPTNEGFERVPESVDIESDFGRLTIEYRKDEGALVADIRYRFDVHRIPVERYSEFREFLSKATSELNETIGIVREQ